MVVTDVGTYTMIVGKEEGEDQDFMAIGAKWGKYNVTLCTSDMATSIECNTSVYTPDHIILYCNKKIPKVFKPGVKVCAIIYNVKIY